MKRRYFVSYMWQKKDTIDYNYSFNIMTINNGIFSIEEIVEVIRKEKDCQNVVIINFKELKPYEKR